MELMPGTTKGHYVTIRFIHRSCGEITTLVLICLLEINLSSQHNQFKYFVFPSRAVLAELLHCPG